MKRIVVTGMSVVSPLGNTIPEFWEGLAYRHDAIQPLTKLDSNIFKGERIASEVKNFNKKEGSKQKLSDAYYYASHATHECLKDADILPLLENDNSYALVIGTTNGNQDIVEMVVDKVDVFDNMFDDDVSSLLSNIKSSKLSTVIAKENNLGGLNLVIPTACAAGNYAISTGFDLINSGETPIAVVGGVDPFTRSCYTIFYKLGAMSQTNCKPFDENRSGMVVGEGCGMMVLEDLDHALARNAKIYGEIRGYGMACDAYHPTTPDPEGGGATQSMSQALKTSNISKEDISFISSHGTGTKANDAHEAKAMYKIFGDSLADIPVNGMKSILGHCMGAASAFEAIAILLSLHNQKPLVTINTDKIDSAFDVSFPINYPKNKDHDIQIVLSNAFAFGGNICSIILSAF